MAEDRNNTLKYLSYFGTWRPHNDDDNNDTDDDYDDNSGKVSDISRKRSVISKVKY